MHERDEIDEAGAPRNRPQERLAPPVLLPTWKSVPSGSRTDATSRTSLPRAAGPERRPRLLAAERRGRQLRQIELPPVVRQAQEQTSRAASDDADEQRPVSGASLHGDGSLRASASTPPLA